MLETRYLLSGICLLIVALQWRASRAIRQNESYHPSYKFEKLAISFVYTAVGIGYLTGASSDPSFRYMTAGLMVTTSFVAYLFIKRRNAYPVYLVTLKTLDGLAEYDARQANRTADIVAGMIRHGYVDKRRRLQLHEALGTPPTSHWVEVEYRKLRERRAARAGIVAEDSLE